MTTIVRISSYLLISFLVSWCGDDHSRRSSVESISDIASVQKRLNARYDVVCSDGRYEAVTAQDLEMNNVCPYVPMVEGGGRVAIGKSRTFTLSTAMRGFKQTICWEV